MQEMILQIMDQFGYLGVFLLIAAENIFPPIPSEVILLFGGFMTTYTALNIAGMTAAATLGSVAGAIVLYFVGKIFNKNRLEKIISGRAGRILKLNNSDIEKADSWFDGRGDKTVFFCRFVPLIRSLISIPAGMSEMAMPRFLAYTSLGSLIWNVVLITAGSIVGRNWESILSLMNTYSRAAAVILGIAFAGAVIAFYRKRIMGKAERRNEHADQRS